MFPSTKHKQMEFRKNIISAK